MRFPALVVTCISLTLYGCGGAGNTPDTIGAPGGPPGTNAADSGTKGDTGVSSPNEGGACTPKTCVQQGLDCGTAGDGCDGQLQCGACSSPQTCGGGGEPGVCGAVGDASNGADGASGQAATSDFEARCNQSGVIVCQGFDDAAVFSPATYPSSGLYPDGNGVIQGAMDTGIVASGAGALKFTVPSMAPANSSGTWQQLFAKDLSTPPTGATVFGENSIWYVQYHQRFSPEYLTNQWPAMGGGTTNWKQSDFCSDKSSCGAIELTTVNGDNKGFPQMYSDCGADGFSVPVGTSDYLLEQGDTSTTGYNCHYQGSNNAPGSCFDYPSNTWVTFYWKIQIGMWGQANSTIQAWSSVGGQPYEEWINMPNHTLNQDGPGDPAYDMLYLETYMTARDEAVSAGPVAYTWYDELIVSTAPIATPNH